jgi:hypothetical protein
MHLDYAMHAMHAMHLDYAMHAMHAMRAMHYVRVIHTNNSYDSSEVHNFEEHAIHAILLFSSHSDQYQF